MDRKEKLLDEIKILLLIEQKSLKPDEDWETRLVFGEEEEVPESVTIPAEHLKTALGKEVLARAIYETILHFKSSLVAMVGMVWTLEQLPEKEAEEIYKSGKSIADDSRKKEALAIDLHDFDSSEMHIAYVTRKENGPPELGEWHEFKQGAKVMGRFHSAISNALALVKSKREEELKAEG